MSERGFLQPFTAGTGRFRGVVQAVDQQVHGLWSPVPAVLSKLLFCLLRGKLHLGIEARAGGEAHQ